MERVVHLRSSYVDVTFVLIPIFSDSLCAHYLAIKNSDAALIFWEFMGIALSKIKFLCLLVQVIGYVTY